jgi:hypothetical protein
MSIVTKATPPARSYQQRVAALRNANRIRTYRAQLKRDLHGGRIDLYEILEPPIDPDLETMRVLELLLAVPKIGRVKANKLLQRTYISPSKTLGGMTHRQRVKLLVELLGADVLRERRRQPRRAAS